MISSFVSPAFHDLGTEGMQYEPRYCSRILAAACTGNRCLIYGLARFKSYIWVFHKFVSGGGNACKGVELRRCCRTTDVAPALDSSQPSRTADKI